MCWKLIPEGPYRPFHQLTFESPLAAAGCFGAKPAAAPAATQDGQAQNGPSWYPVIQVVIDALNPFEEACVAVSQALVDHFPQSFPEPRR